MAACPDCATRWRGPRGTQPAFCGSCGARVPAVEATRPGRGGPPSRSVRRRPVVLWGLAVVVLATLAVAVRHGGHRTPDLGLVAVTEAGPLGAPLARDDAPTCTRGAQLVRCVSWVRDVDARELVTRDQVVATSDGREVTGLDLRTGTVQWRVELGGARLVPTADALVAASTRATAGIDPATGSIRWRIADEQPLRRDRGDGDALVTTRTVDGRTRLQARAPATGRPIGAARTVPPGVAAVATGGLVVLHDRDSATLTAWPRTDLGGDPYWTTASSARRLWPGPIVGDTLLLFEIGPRGAAAPVWLRAVHARSGTSRWAVEVDGLDVAVRGDVLVARRDGATLGIDLATGTPRWRLAHAIPVPMAPGSEDLLVAREDGVDHVAAVDPATGAIRWQQEVDDRPLGAVRGTNLLVVSTERGLHALDPGDGTVVARLRTHVVQTISAHPLLVNGPGRLLLVDADRLTMGG